MDRRHNINCQCQTCQSCALRPRAAQASQRVAGAQAAQAQQQRAAAKLAANQAAAAPPPAQSARKPALGRNYLSAYAKDFRLTPTAQGTVVPLERQRGEGGCAFKHGVATIPEDGFYMLLWELGLICAQGCADLRLGINQMGTVLSHAPKPGYDSGQQVTWLNKGDQIGLQLAGEGEQPEMHGSDAQLTILRMG